MNTPDNESIEVTIYGDKSTIVMSLAKQLLGTGVVFTVVTPRASVKTKAQWVGHPFYNTRKDALEALYRFIYTERTRAMKEAKRNPDLGEAYIIRIVTKNPPAKVRSLMAAAQDTLSLC